MLKLDTGPIFYHKPCTILSMNTWNGKLPHFAGTHVHSSNKWGAFWKSPLSVGNSGVRKGSLEVEFKDYTGIAAKFTLHFGTRREQKDQSLLTICTHLAVAAAKIQLREKIQEFFSAFLMFLGPS